MLYHFSPKYTDAHLGVQLSTPKESFYWTQKLTKNWVPKMAITTGNQAVDDAVKGVAPLISHGKYTAELLKEFVFEDIRQQEFPLKPSRRRCLFAFAFNDPNAYAAKLQFPRDKYQLFSVSAEPDARIHYADLACLDVNLLDYSGYVAAARKYWNGADPNSINTEVLLEGAFMLSRVV